MTHIYHTPNVLSGQTAWDQSSRPTQQLRKDHSFLITPPSIQNTFNVKNILFPHQVNGTSTIQVNRINLPVTPIDEQPNDSIYEYPPTSRPNTSSIFPVNNINLQPNNSIYEYPKTSRPNNSSIFPVNNINLQPNNSIYEYPLTSRPNMNYISSRLSLPPITARNFPSDSNRLNLSRPSLARQFTPERQMDFTNYEYEVGTYIVPIQPIYRPNDVFINVYDIDGKIRYLNNITRRFFNFGVFHLGIEIYGKEYSFGMVKFVNEKTPMDRINEIKDNLIGEEYSSKITNAMSTIQKNFYHNPKRISGILGTLPRCHPNHIYRETCHIGRSTTVNNIEDVDKILEKLKNGTDQWLSNRYDLLHNNCIDFVFCFLEELGIPKQKVPEFLFALRDSVRNRL